MSESRQQDQKKIDWFSFSQEDILHKNKVTLEEGLSQDEVTARQELYGKNTLPEAPKTSIIIIFLRQFKNPLLYVLMAAATTAFFLGEVVDSLVIWSVLIFNGIIGAFQEGKAQDALFALKKFSTTETLVRRSGKLQMILSDDVVPGDIVVIKEGDKIPADIRIMATRNMYVNESILTGESVPVSKLDAVISREDVPITDQYNMLFKGTTVTRGQAEGVVVATGTSTALGRISQTLIDTHAEIPLQASLNRLINAIMVIVSGVIGVLFVVGLLTGNTFKEMLLVTVSLMVSVFPDGLPIVMTLILAHGVKRMSEKNVLVKRLQAVEALGEATVIAVDKTGTLTRNEMTVQELFTMQGVYQVTGIGYDPVGTIIKNGDIYKGYDVDRLALLAAISPEAEVIRMKEEIRLTGDPTEAALVVLGEKIGFSKKDLEKEGYKILDNLPFAYEKKYYATLIKEPNQKETTLIVVGAPETILEKTLQIIDAEGSCSGLGELIKKELAQKVFEYSQQGLRIIAVAEKNTYLEKLDDRDVEGLCFVGFYAMKDAMRQEVPEAMRLSREAGMRVVMITGDHKVTAEAIAREAGVFTDGDQVMTGDELHSYDEEALINGLEKVTVFARVTPDDKLRIIQAYQRAGHIIAMTGDGVNDVPSLVAADLGVAMGNIGTEVAKESADIILLDDNFGNIPQAVQEGRSIYMTIKKTLLYLFSTNLAELLVIAIAVVAVLPLPLTPAQLVWLNLVTDSFLVLVIAFLPVEKDEMEQGSFRVSRYILDMRTTIRLVFFGLAMTAGTFAVFFFYRQFDIHIARTMTFLTLSLFQLFRLWSVRSRTQSVFTENPFKAPWLILASLVAIALQVIAIHVPFMHKILDTVPLRIHDWGIAAGVAFSIILMDEIRKIFLRRKERKNKKA
jgi:Ca2+-transporting ATPase